MLHVPITETDNERQRVEFSHIIDEAADENTWAKGDISLDNFKINVFVRGDFSVVVENERYVPLYGDFSVFVPHRVHYGRIVKPTELEYYQLDIGTDAFSALPGGSALLSELSRRSAECGAFVRPDNVSAKELLSLCEKISASVQKGNMLLAFLYIAEAVEKMSEIYGKAERGVGGYLSKHTSRAVSYINEHYSGPITISEIADTCKVSTSYLSRQFKSEIGVSVHDYITNLRITKATNLLDKMNVAQTAAHVGFCDSSHFIAVFKKKLGITPSEYLKKR